MAPAHPPGPSPRADVRLEDGPLQPVECRACGATVLARKSSWDQTTLQWDGPALRRCSERAAARPLTDRPNRRGFAGCSALGDTVREAAVRGTLEVHSDQPSRTNPEALR